MGTQSVGGTTRAIVAVALPAAPGRADDGPTCPLGRRGSGSWHADRPTWREDPAGLGLSVAIVPGQACADRVSLGGAAREARVTWAGQSRSACALADD